MSSLEQSIENELVKLIQMNDLAVKVFSVKTTTSVCLGIVVFQSNVKQYLNTMIESVNNKTIKGFFRMGKSTKIKPGINAFTVKMFFKYKFDEFQKYLKEKEERINRINESSVYRDYDSNGNNDFNNKSSTTRKQRYKKKRKRRRKLNFLSGIILGKIRSYLILFIGLIIVSYIVSYYLI